MNASKLKQYLSKTDQDWSAGNTPAYLATVKELLAQEHQRSAQNASDQIVSVGDGGTWEGYTNRPLRANQEYRYGRGNASRLSYNYNYLRDICVY